MSKAKKGLLLCLVAGIAIGLLFIPGCSNQITIKEAGSTTVLPLAEEFAIEFMERYPNVRVETGGGGSGAGVQQCAAGTVNIGAISRELKETEPDLMAYPVAYDALAIIVNIANPIKGLTLKELAGIFSGEIRDWREVGGKAGTITIHAREEGSGTRDVFEEEIMRNKKISAQALLWNSSGGIQLAVSKDISSIGFVSFAYREGVKTLAVEGIELTIENCRNGNYPLVRPLYFLTRGAPSGLVETFIDFCRSEEGQRIVAEADYIPLK